MPKYIRQDVLQEAVLFQLFEIAQQTDGYVGADLVAQQFSILLGEKRIKLALESLEDRELISYYSQQGRSTISLKGYAYVEKALAEQDTLIAVYAAEGDDWLQTQTIGADAVPAADRIVKRSDNQPEIDEIIGALGDLNTSLETDNEVGDALGDERDVAIGEVAASTALVSANRFQLRKLFQILMPLLRYLADKFGAGAIGETAKKLTNLLMSLL